MDSNKELAYLIMQHKYLQMLGFDNYNDKIILENYYEFFPENWMLEYDVDQRISFMSIALKNKKNLNVIMEKYFDDNKITK